MYRMMIVDDEEHIVNSIYDMMDEKFDFELYRCYSAVQAVGLLKKMRFDIVLTDISMPQMSGLELMKIAKNLWPKCYVLILTAYNKFDYAYEALKYDRVDYLLKLESYDKICTLVEAKRKSIEQERAAEERLRQYDHHLHHMTESMCHYFLKRIVIQGIPLPEQSDLDAVGLKMNLNRPVLPALAVMNVQGAVEQKLAAANIEDTLNAQLAQYNLVSYTYPLNGYMLFALQTTQEDTSSDEKSTVYAHTVLESLPQIVEKQAGQNLAVLCAEHFTDWKDVHALYQRAAPELEKLRNESGMMILSDSVPQTQTSAITFPNMEEVYLLWEMLKNNNMDGFAEMMRKGTGELRGVRNLQAILPNASVSAIGYLLQETVRTYAPKYAVSGTFRAIAACRGYDNGEVWLHDVMDTIERIVRERAESREKNGVWMVERVNQYIEQHYAEDITLTTLADLLHYSSSYLSRYYKMNTGKNLMNHIYDVRIAHAKLLLMQTNLKMGEIAAATGFCSSKYFNRIFKKTEGISTAEYRNQCGKMHKSEV